MEFGGMVSVPLKGAMKKISYRTYRTYRTLPYPTENVWLAGG